jgi:hypothetical protein
VRGPGRGGLGRVQVYCVLQPGSEGGDDLAGVMTGPVEPAIRHVPDPAAHRIGQGGGGQGGGSHRHRRFDGQRRGQQYQPGVHPRQQAGHDGIGQGPRDDPVDVAAAFEGAGVRAGMRLWRPARTGARSGDAHAPHGPEPAARRSAVVLSSRRGAAKPPAACRDGFASCDVGPLCPVMARLRG